MTSERRVHIPTLAEIRRETAAAFMTSPDDDLMRAHVIGALLAIFIPVLLIQLALISAVAQPLPAFLISLLLPGENARTPTAEDPTPN